MADLFSAVCGVCIVTVWATGGLFMGMGAAMSGSVQAMERKKQVLAPFFRWRWKETETLEWADVFHVVCGLCVVSGWVAGGLFIGTAGVV